MYNFCQYKNQLAIFFLSLLVASLIIYYTRTKMMPIDYILVLFLTVIFFFVFDYFGKLSAKHFMNEYITEKFINNRNLSSSLYDYYENFEEQANEDGQTLRGTMMNEEDTSPVSGPANVEEDVPQQEETNMPQPIDIQGQVSETVKISEELPTQQPQMAPPTTTQQPQMAPPTTTQQPQMAPPTTTQQPQMAPPTTTQQPQMAPPTTTQQPQMAPPTQIPTTTTQQMGATMDFSNMKLPNVNATINHKISFDGELGSAMGKLNNMLNRNMIGESEEDKMKVMTGQDTMMGLSKQDQVISMAQPKEIPQFDTGLDNNNLMAKKRGMLPINLNIYNNDYYGGVPQKKNFQ